MAKPTDTDQQDDNRISYKVAISQPYDILAIQERFRDLAEIGKQGKVDTVFINDENVSGKSAYATRHGNIR
tara:strand:+ start:401 stop:613 length:213 start_codon:yes stop_codon:yes gene_type:complete